MKYIDSWLQGLGLDYVTPKLKAHGITNPKKLAQLTLRDMFDFGVEDSEDRKKLYFLVQRLQTILNSKASEDEDDKAQESEAVESEDVISNSNPLMSIPIPDLNDENKGNKQERNTTKMVDSSLSKKAFIGATPLVHPQTATTSMGTSTTGPPSQNVHEKTIPGPSNQTNTITTKGTLQQQQPQFLKSKSSESSGSDKQSQSKRKDAINSVDSTSQGSIASSSTLSQLSSESFGALGDDNENLLDRKINMFLKGTPPTSAKGYNSGSHTSCAVSSVAPKYVIPVQKPISLPSVNVVDSPAVVQSTKPIVSVASKNTTTSTAISVSAPPTKHVQSTKVAPLQVPSEAPSVAAGHERIQKPSSILPSTVPTPRSQPALEVPDYPASEVITDMAIRVVVRKRPISQSELQRGDSDVMEIDEAGGVYIHEPKVRVDLTKITETHQFYFDDAFEADESNELMYSRTIGQLVPFMFSGGKASCFAYGQTGSGKTFTMMGANPAAPDTVVENAGLYVIAARDIFGLLKSPDHKNLQLFVSCFEIYSGKLFDLLNDRGIVKCLEDAKQQVQLVGLSEHRVESVQGLLALMGKGHAMRSTGSTGANATSSRSHQIMQLVVKEPARAETTSGGLGNRHRHAVASTAPVLVPRGKLSFIDLAGSERGADTCNASKQTRLEGAEINTSLLALKEVIRSLERKHGHTPFRGSKLTQVLKDSFVGEKSRTCMIACVSPSHSNCEHTLNTLRYADRVKEHQSSQSGSATPTYPDSDRAASPLGRENRGGGGRSGPPSPSRKGISGSPIRGIASSPEKNVKSMLPSKLDGRPPPLPHTAPTSSRSVLSSETQSSRRASVGNLTSRSTGIPKTQRRTSVAPTLSSSASAPSKVCQSYHPKNVSTKTQDTAVYSTKINGVSARGLMGPTIASTPDPLLGEKSTILLTAHKATIATFVEMMKTEMALVQEMESADDRDSELYVDRLEDLLSDKEDTITTLRQKIKSFQKYRINSIV